MLTVIWGTNGFHVVDLMVEGTSFDSRYFIDRVMTALIRKISPSGRKSHAPRLHVHLDNCRVHTSKRANEFFEANRIVRVPQPPYTPDLAPPDFWRFGNLKGSLAGQTFDDPEELFDAIIDFLEAVPRQTLIDVFQAWINRIEWVLQHKGDYSHE
jgi:transposase